MFDEKTYGTFCTADLWRKAQISRSAYLGFWLRSLFRKRLPYGLKKSKQGVPLSVVLEFPPRKPDVAVSIAGLPSSQAQRAAAALIFRLLRGCHVMS
jgi:hypothetical protein